MTNDLAKALRLICALLGATVALACAPSWVQATDASAGSSSELPKSASASSSVIDSILTQKSNEDDFLQPDEAFQFAATPAGPDSVRLTWQIADGYYLYRSRIKAATTSDRAQIGTLAMPQGQSKKDDYFGLQEIYHHQIVATLPVARSAGGAFDLPLKVTYQGCAEKGICYTPITKTINVTLPASTASTSGGSAGSAADGSAGFVSEQDRYASIIRDSNIVWVVLFFLAAGVGFSFTSCVLPMVPIVSGIIIGDGRNISTKRSFALSVAYVLGMAITYTAAGMAVAAGGQQVQAAFQQPWIIVLFAAVFVVLSLSMFGFYTLQMPAALQTRLATVSNRQSAGTYGGVAVMGALSALIVTTCVAPALVGALLFIGQSGNMARGGVALFSMAIGMGTPLLVVGASAGKVLPKAGPWMDLVKRLFGSLMLVVSAWMLDRVVPERFAPLLWIVPLASAAIVLWTGARGLRRALIPVRVVGVAAGVFTVLVAAGAVITLINPAGRVSAGQTGPQLTFRTIKSVGDLQHAVTDAKAQGKSVMLDFYADWCTSCKEMERFTFSDSTVQSALNGVVLLRADVTANDDDDQALLKHFGIFGPPTIAFYGIDGEERHKYRVVGFMKAADFAILARQALGPGAAAPAAAPADPQAVPSPAPQTTAGVRQTTASAAGAT
jgi:thioredoxin:protein disulfide reductase